MKKKRLYLCILALCLTASFCGCRKKAAETESETQTVTETETQTEKATEKKTEKATEKTTEKTTEKKTVSAGTKTSSTEKTTVKPSTVKPGTTTGTTTRNTAGTNTGTYPTQMCPYCYNQISTAPNGDGTTVYSVHVAQEKAWADTYGYGSTPATEATQPSTNTSSGNSGSTDNSAQCPYCYQWFSVSDGTYNAHVTQEQNYIASNNSTTEYVQCPKCGNVYPSGSAYDNHVCASN